MLSSAQFNGHIGHDVGCSLESHSGRARDDPRPGARGWGGLERSFSGAVKIRIYSPTRRVSPDIILKCFRLQRGIKAGGYRRAPRFQSGAAVPCQLVIFGEPMRRLVRKKIEEKDESAAVPFHWSCSKSLHPKSCVVARCWAHIVGFLHDFRASTAADWQLGGRSLPGPRRGSGTPNWC